MVCVKTLTPLAFGALLVLVMSCDLRAQAKPAAVVEDLKLKARHAEDTNNLNQAENLYLEALNQAKQRNSQTEVVEILSRVTRVRIDNKKLNQTAPLVQDAIRVVSGLKGQPAYDPEMSVWMDDMADAFYEQGEHTSSAQIKEYCYKQYVEIKLAVADRYNEKLASRFSLFTTYLYHQGRYREAVPIMEKIVQYLQFTNPKAKNVIAFNYQVLANAYLGVHDPIKAEAACNQAIRLEPNDLNQKALMERKIGQAKSEENRSADAIDSCTHALNVHNTCTPGPNLHSGWDAFVLGLIQQRTGNLIAAGQCYQNSLGYFDKCAAANSSHPNPVDLVCIESGQVMAAESLARIVGQRGDKALSDSLVKRAQKIRTHHSEWNASRNPDAVDFYAIWGYLPFPIELIRTRSSLF